MAGRTGGQFIFGKKGDSKAAARTLWIRLPAGVPQMGMSDVAKLVETALGLDVEPRELRFLQLLLRTFVVFFATLAMIRVAGRRFLARRNPFDVLLGFIMASM